MNKFEINVREDKRQSARSAGFDSEVVQDFPVTYTPVRSGIFNIYLFGEIVDARQFISAIEVLQAASKDDVVVIHLSTNGGSLDATDTFLAEMHDCEAKIIVKASGGVHSAGSVILMYADEFYLSENFNCLIHNGSTGAGGKFSDFRAQAKHTQAYMEKVMRKTYAGFLTEEELEALLDGKDYWLDAAEFAERFDNRQKYLAARMEEAEEAVKTLMQEKKPAPKKRKKAVEVAEQSE